ncbi:MAG: crossover junction endodeoxyribonuclease RuvC [Hydrogenothermaceae bacterium]|nr:crossover junction endodeoxyribonuclease RuvC [Hydrogenothermaceae bacterium]
MRLLSFDPSSSKTGYAVADLEDDRLSILETGILDLKKKREPLLYLYKELNRLLEKFKPDKVLLETPFYSINAQTLIKLGEVRGVVLLACQTFNIEVEEFTPAEVKICITGYGRASKEEVLNMVNSLYKLNLDSYDIADAVAILHTYIMQVKV